MATIIPSVCTEQQALTYSLQYPNLVFYASDTGKIISNGGEVYGKDSVSSPLVRVGGDVTVSLSALSGEMFDNTLAQSAAITASSTNTDVIYLATDTKAIIKAGVIYGGSVDVAKPFKFAPDLTDQSNWDTNYIYVVPSSTNILLYAYVSGAWANVSTQTITLETDASGINYDLTNTPNLGNGDVQSAIEDEDAKVEQLSLNVLGEYTDSSTEDYWEELLYEKKGYSEISPNNRRIGATHAGTTDTTGNGRKVYIFPASEGDVFKVTGANGSGDWTGFWKGGTTYSSITAANYLSSASVASGTYTAPANATLFAFVSIDARFTSDLAHVWKKTTKPSVNIADKTGMKIDGWVLSSIQSTSLAVGATMPYWATATGTYGKRLEVKAGQVLLVDLMHTSTIPLVFTDENRVITEKHKSPVRGAFVVPNDGFAYMCNLATNETDNYVYNEGHGGIVLYENLILQEYYNKGLADGSAMASIVGLGYNIWDYITGAVNMAGFEYGCEIRDKYRLNAPTVTGNAMFQNNTNLVYFPKFPQGSITTLYNMCYGDSNMITFECDWNISGSCYQVFYSCTKLNHVKFSGNLKPTSVEGMFRNCVTIEYIPKIDTSDCTGWQYAFAVGDGVLRRIEEIDLTKMGTHTSGSYNWFRAGGGIPTKLRYLLAKNLGANSACTGLTFSSVSNWGIPNASYADTSDARQSLIDTLITYSFDRATAEYSTCTVTLSAATKALLTTEELEQITAKGYTIA